MWKFFCVFIHIFLVFELCFFFLSWLSLIEIGKMLHNWNTRQMLKNLCKKNRKYFYSLFYTLFFVQVYPYRWHNKSHAKTTILLFHKKRFSFVCSQSIIFLQAEKEKTNMSIPFFTRSGSLISIPKKWNFLVSNLLGVISFQYNGFAFFPK